MDAGKAVAIGFEAPMWIHKHTSGNKFNKILSERFVEEGTKYRWYFSSGASASAMAIPLGGELFHEIKKIFSSLKVTTDYQSWKKKFEGYFAGENWN
ncbi:hypothetical protein [Paenibacillus xylanexedens]|uniref:hypothetical protein n=1 Tax=Paenibacillus xylanexedens TaxID=528191 RepID=UPI0011AAF45E|nr:hypothetical protein [Paenibacillus xylanexedens]